MFQGGAIHGIGWGGMAMDAIRLLGELNAKVQDSTSHGLQFFSLFAREVDKDIPTVLLSRSSTVPVAELHLR
jgi:hypothetical protein